MRALTEAARSEAHSDLSAAASGDEYAFERIVAAYDDDMYRVCVAVCRDQTIAADAVQAAWLIAWRKLHTVRDPARVRPWLVSVAVNEGRKLLNKRSRHRIDEYRDPGIDPATTDPATGIAGIDLRLALERLDPGDRALLAMRYVAGFNATELGAAIGLSPSGTRARLARLIDRLHEELR